MKQGDRVRWKWHPKRVPFLCDVLAVEGDQVVVQLLTGRIVQVGRWEIV